jgi:large subunit ribosomal protein L23
MNKNPYEIIKRQHVTEKAKVLQELQTNDSNASVRRCKTPKYVFVVDSRANKREIADALEEIYQQNKIKVVSVNTINVKSKPRRVRGRLGKTASFKKAIVTLEEGDSIENV